MMADGDPNVSFHVTISGPALAMHMFNFTTSKGDTEGLMFGTRRVVTKLTQEDANADVRSWEHHVAITSFVSLRDCGQIFDDYGNVDDGSLAMLLADTHQELVGYYRVRRNSPLRPSAFDYSKLRGLCDCYASMRRDDEDASLLFGLFRSLAQAGAQGTAKCIQNYDFAFMRASRPYPECRLILTNVVAEILSVKHPEESEYVFGGTDSPALVSNMPDFFQDGDSQRTREAAMMERLSKDVLQQFRAVCQEVARSELELQRLRDDVEQLRQERMYDMQHMSQ